ncbi:hypothetical protein, partial [Xanthomonas citri]
ARLKKNSGKEVLFRKRCWASALLGWTGTPARGAIRWRGHGAQRRWVEKKLQKSVDSKKKRD